jgi:hypothetical protein
MIDVGRQRRADVTASDAAETTATCIAAESGICACR